MVYQRRISRSKNRNRKRSITHLGEARDTVQWQNACPAFERPWVPFPELHFF
jgi:hypothetical protein